MFIITPNSTSAIELKRMEEGLVFKESQLLSTCNKKPSLHHRIVADILKNELNIHLLKNNYEDRIKRYQDIIFLNKGLLANTPDKSTKLNQVMFDIDGGAADDDTLIWVDEAEPIRGRRGGVIGEQVRADRRTLGDLDALQGLRDQLEANRNIVEEFDDDFTEIDLDDLDLLE